MRRFSRESSRRADFRSRKPLEFRRTLAGRCASLRGRRVLASGRERMEYRRVTAEKKESPWVSISHANSAELAKCCDDNESRSFVCKGLDRILITGCCD